MATTRMGLTGKVANEYLKENPSMSKRGLAKKMLAEQAPLFTGLSHARTAIRSAIKREGDTMGKSAPSLPKGVVEDNDGTAICGQKGFTIDPTAELPASDAVEWKPFPIDEGLRKTLVMADIHIPYQINEVIGEAFKCGENNKIDSIILDGDIIDCYQLSRFLKDPRMRDFAGEMRALNIFLDVLHNRFPKAKIFYKLGNHDLRVDKYIMKDAPGLLNLDCLSIAAMINAVARGVAMIADQRRIRYGKLWMLHGDEWRGGMANPVNPARGAWLKTFDNVVTAHLHQATTHSERGISGQSFTDWSLGCMCDLNPPYCRMNKWNWGFGIAEKDGSGNFNYSNYKVSKEKGKFVTWAG